MLTATTDGTVQDHLAIRMQPIAALRPYAGNARTHSRRQIRQIAESIERFGFTNPVLTDDAGEIIAGHGRVAAAELLGLVEVPTIRLSHLSPEERRAYVLADNKLAENAGWDRDILAIELQGLLDVGFDLELTGFSLTEIDVSLDEPGRPGILLNLDPYVLFEVLDPATGIPVADGEFGEIVVTSLYHFDNPSIRNRLRDGGVFRQGGRRGAVRNFHGIEVASIGRIDDVRKVKGINIYPQAVDDLVFSWPEVEQYEVVLTRTANYSDVATLRLQLREPLEGAAAEAFLKSVNHRVKERLGIHFVPELARSIDVGDYKAKRWRDLR